MAQLPLGDVRQHSPSVMLNILGDVWFGQDGKVREPAWDKVLKYLGEVGYREVEGFGGVYDDPAGLRK